MLLLDEPTSSLDPRQREVLWAFVTGLAEAGTAVVYATHNVAEAERYADRVLVLADGELLFSGSPRELEQTVGRRRGARLRGARSSASSTSAATEMRWLLLKDLQILKRSPLLVAVLIAYSVVVSLVAGAALSSGPSKPRVAFANLVPQEQSEVALGGRKVDATQYADKLFDEGRPDPRQDARGGDREGQVRRGARARSSMPADVTQKLQGTLGLGGSGRPTVEVYYSAENPLKTQFVKDTIDSTLAEANAAISAEVLKESAKYLERDRGGREGRAADRRRRRHPRPAQRARDHRGRASPGCRRTRRSASALEQVSRFAGLAADNLDLSKPILASISKPVQVKRDRGLRLQLVAERVRGRGRGGRLDDVRRAAAGGRACSRSSARRTRSAGSCAG